MTFQAVLTRAFFETQSRQSQFSIGSITISTTVSAQLLTEPLCKKGLDQEVIPKQRH